MNDDTRKHVSDLVDGEVHSLKLRYMLDRLEQDGELQQCWECYYLISDALKNNLPDTLDLGLARRVMAALDAESRVRVPLVFKRLSFRDAASLAMAASIAAVAVFATQWWGHLREGNPPSLASPGVQTGTVPMSVSPPTSQQTLAVASPDTPLDSRQETRQAPELVGPPGSSGSPSAKASDDRINDYLIDHSVYAARTGMQGMMPYVRVVGHGYR
jgi:sigma-E factor negative regulatory protein RseA